MKTLFSPLALFVISSLVLFSQYGWTKVEYDSEQLRMKNAEQINDLVTAKIKKAQEIQKKQDIDDDSGILAEPEAVSQLKQATIVVLARPDQDGTRNNAFGKLRRELTDLNAYEVVIREVGQGAIRNLKDKKTPIREQATHIVLLENMMAELKPDVPTTPWIKTLFEEVRDADIKVSDKVRTHQIVRSMTRLVSPSKTAETIVGKKK